jgi:hypothetical protein
MNIPSIFIFLPKLCFPNIFFGNRTAQVLVGQTALSRRVSRMPTGPPLEKIATGTTPSAMRTPSAFFFAPEGGPTPRAQKL